MKSAQLERQLGKLDEALKTLEDAIKKFPQFDKLHMIRGQIYDSRGDIPAARQAYAQGCRSCPKSVPLWILSARLEIKAGVIIKARSLLERARLSNPKNDELWAESIKIEEKASGPQQAKSLLARGEFIYQSIGSSGSLLIDQQCRNVPHHLFCGLWLFGWKTPNSERDVH
jgi:pre-mRNA-processing factor 6